MTPSGDLSGGPHLMAAFLCEKVLQEKDGVLSFIRVVDRFVRPRPTAQVPPQVLQCILVTAFKAGGIGSGTFKIKIRMYKPNATSATVEIENDAFFEGGQDFGAVTGLPFIVMADEEGLYWIDVLFEDNLVTRIPFRVIFAAIQAMQPQPPA